MRYPLFVLFLFLLLPCKVTAQNSFDAFTDKFVAGNQSLHISGLEMSYVDDLKHIKSADQVKQQLDFFTSISNELKSFNINSLDASQRQDYNLIAYETNLNLERITLEQQWNSNKPSTITAKGIYSVPNGKAWYAYLLKNWLSANVTPDEIYQFGLAEVERVKQHIESIRKATKLSEDDFYKHLNDPEFFISDQADLQKRFEHTRDVIYGNMSRVFNEHSIPPLKIEKGSNNALAQTPGYYDDNTFYYNLFDKPYNKRQIAWLFIHEAVPGHHYQSSVAAATDQSKVQKLYFFIGFAEGWAAYTEELGKELGAYQTPYDELGKWEWDIVRSVRVPMDIGLNYYGWTDEQALAFWKKNIRNQDDIAMREIARVKRWPAQAISYKYGAAQIMLWKRELEQKQGKAFDIKAFHDAILNHASLPIFMVKDNVFGKR